MVCIERVLVVDSTAITNSPRLIEHDGFRRPSCAETIGHHLPSVAQQAHARFEIALKSAQFGVGFVLERINGEETDATGLVMLDESRKPRSV